MAIVAVQDYSRSKVDKTQDLLNKISTGLQIAQSIYGFKTASEQSDLRNLQIQREKQIVEAGGLDLEQSKRTAKLAKEGIMEMNKFNEEYYSIDPTQADTFIKQYNYPLQTVKIRVEDPSEKTGFKEVIAIDKDDIKEAQKAAFEASKWQAENEKVTPKPTPKPTAGSFQAAGFADRIKFSNDQFNELEKTGFDRASYGTALLSTLTKPLGEVGDVFKNEELKLWDQSVRNFINAVLRRESGAAIAPSEFASAEAQYIPVAGDSPAVKEAKRKNRDLVLQSLQREAEYGMTGKIPLLENARSSLNQNKQKIPLPISNVPVDRTKETDDAFLQRYELEQ